jgi:serine/threonine protein kinase
MLRHNNYLGQTIGNYIILERLGSGGFGSVYRAQNKLITERVVAIKVINEQYISSPEECKYFLNEARVLLRLQHPYILPIFDIGEHEGIPYIVLELAPTGSLNSYIERQQHRPLPIDKALLIISQVGQGLYFAHQQHIVHRDLKPDNILFNAKGDAMLADFGISLEVATSTQRNAAITGTPPYMAPEQFQGTTSMLSDQYALGCITYELLTGQRPFQATNFTEWAIQHTQKTPIPPRQLNPSIPVHVEQAILKAMAKDRTQRFANVAAFIEALSTQKTLPAVPAHKVLKSPAGQTVLDKGEVTIGRGHDNTYALVDAQVSNHHAVIRQQGEDYAIADLASTNKTYVNGQVLSPHTARVLKPGDVIRIGQTNFEFTNEISAPPPTVAAPLPTIAAPLPTVAAPPSTVVAPSSIIAPPPPTVAAPAPSTRIAQPAYAPSQYQPASVLMDPQIVPTPSAPKQKRTTLWVVLSIIGVIVILGIIGLLTQQTNTAKDLVLNRTYTGSADTGITVSVRFTGENQSTGEIQGLMNTSQLNRPCSFNNGTVDSQGNIKFLCSVINTSGTTLTYTITGTVSSDNSNITNGTYNDGAGDTGTWTAQET